MTPLYQALKPMALGALHLIESRSTRGGGLATPFEHDADVELVRRALGGERAAVDLLVERLQCIPRILGVFNQRMGGALEAGDMAELAQDVLATFWSRIGDYTGKASLETWAYGFCLNTFLAFLRRRRVRTHERLDEEGFADTRGVELGLDDHERLHRALGLLEAREERMIRLKYFDQLTFEEIGTNLRLSPNTVKTCFYRGMRRLEQLLRGGGARKA